MKSMDMRELAGEYWKDSWRANLDELCGRDEPLDREIRDLVSERDAREYARRTFREFEWITGQAADGVVLAELDGTQQRAFLAALEPHWTGHVVGRWRMIRQKRAVDAILAEREFFFNVVMVLRGPDEKNKQSLKELAERLSQCVSTKSAVHPEGSEA